ncbi:MAG: CHAD domain-containing protein [Actinomycetia bacterium]|nr:CHAD domain-containing protein [Actinomycetes bacterium]MCP4958094.1 CHAD domain-containing protein [Actinomycetes bacterium]
MAFSVERHETARAAVRRVVSESLDDALERLTLYGSPGHDDTKAVHEIRKRCKEVRGVCDLVRPKVGEDAKAVASLCRGAARGLAGSRDATVAAATLANMRDDWGVDTSSIDIHAVVSSLADAKVDSRDIDAARTMLSNARQMADEWKLGKGFGSLRAGLEETYSKGLGRLTVVLDGADDEALHRLRTSAKRLWYQVRLLQSIAPSVLAPMVDQLDGIGEAIGDHHDLYVLRGALLIEPDEDRRRVAEAAKEIQAHLESMAVAAGLRVYAESPPAFVERVATYWRLARDEIPDVVFPGD